MRHTKIVCTIGPASEGEDVIRALLEAGMNVARVNFSHGSPQEHAARIDRLRRTADRLRLPLGIILDIQGPKVRVGQVAGGKVSLEPEQTFVLTTEPVTGNGSRAYVDYPQLAAQVHPGSTIYLDDGMIELVVAEVRPPEVVCRVMVGGDLASRKGVSLPGVSLDLSPLGGDDVGHIRFGIEHGVDFIAASFVRRAEHVAAVKAVIAEAGADLPVIAKIESAEGVQNLDEIIEAADGVMVARGDLGVHIPPEEVPLVQKEIILRCNRAGKPVITATQMLESMVRNPRPTRAEVTDVANAIFEGTDAVMLSGETAVGRYPVKAVRIMDRIARRIEDSIDYYALLERRRVGVSPSAGEAISYATCRTAADLAARAIISSTQSGSTARMVSKFRPQCPIIAVTPAEAVVRQLTLTWGVYPLRVPRAGQIDEMIDVSVAAALAAGLVRRGDTVAITAGVKTDLPGSTNLLQVYTVDKES